MLEKTRILFFSESVTLAHVARPLVLAQSLDPALYEVHFAHSFHYRPLLGELSFKEHQIESISPDQFMAALASGTALYDLPTLSAYVEEDLRLIGEVRPHIVVGDFRLSLAVSAELAGVLYITISNACWSPYTLQHYTVPELPLTRLLGPRLGQWVFSLARPLAFALHSIPMHRLRRRYGLKSLGFNLCEVYTHADYTLYADLPGVYQTSELPENHRFIGPVIWSPSIPFADWWSEIPDGPAVIYVTLGSSGHASILPDIIAVLGQMDVIALVSTAGATIDILKPDNIYLSSYLPGEDAVRQSDLVICNGGSPTTYQALAHGKPVIGVAGNLDQHLNMQAIATTGAGIHLRSDGLTLDAITHAVEATLTEKKYKRSAGELATMIAECDSCSSFQEAVERAL